MMHDTTVSLSLFIISWDRSINDFHPQSVELSSVSAAKAMIEYSTFFGIVKYHISFPP